MMEKKGGERRDTSGRKDCSLLISLSLTSVMKMLFVIYKIP